MALTHTADVVTALSRNTAAACLFVRFSGAGECHTLLEADTWSRRGHWMAVRVFHRGPFGYAYNRFPTPTTGLLGHLIHLARSIENRHADCHFNWPLCSIPIRTWVSAAFEMGKASGIQEIQGGATSTRACHLSTFAVDRPFESTADGRLQIYNFLPDRLLRSVLGRAV